MKPTILIQLDSDLQPSVFDSVVAIDAGAQQLLRHGGVKPEAVRDLVHGAMFTRGVEDLRSTAVFIGGSDAGAGEAILRAVKDSFFGPFRVSVLFDPGGCNTTAAAAVLAAMEGMQKARGGPDGAKVAVLAATGPVGQRVTRLLAGQDARLEVRVGSRRLDRAQAVAASLSPASGQAVVPFATGTREELSTLIEGVDVIISAGAAGVSLLPADLIQRERPKVLIDLNAVPPAGIEGVEPGDKAKDRGGSLCWGALGVGGTKMKIHRRAIQELFAANDRVIDAEECLAIGKTL
jgi:hypothetical protein